MLAKHILREENEKQAIILNSEREEVEKTYNEATDRLILSQITPRHEQKSLSWSSFQSSKTLATLLNDALIDINAFPVKSPFQ